MKMVKSTKVDFGIKMYYHSPLHKKKKHFDTKLDFIEIMTSDFIFDVFFLCFYFLLASSILFVSYIAEFSIKMIHFLSTRLWLYIFLPKCIFVDFTISTK